MKPSYKFIDHTADVLFQAQAGTLNELFQQCALALEETQVDLSKVEQKESITIKVEHKDVEGLLFDFLDDLVFYKDADSLIFSRFDVYIEEKEGKYFLTCQAYGEKIDHQKHDPKVDVKAITMHLFEVKKTDEGWYAKVLIDI